MTTNLTDMHGRVDHAISRVTASKAASEVLAEINRDHVILPRAAVATYLESLGWRDVYFGDVGSFLDALHRAGVDMTFMDGVGFWHPPVDDQGE